MRGLRTVASAVAILVGATLVVGWLAAGAALRAVNDGAVASTLTRVVLANPAVAERIGAVIEREASASLAQSGVDLEALGLQDQLRELMTLVAGSDAFEQVVLEQVDAVHTELRDELARDRRPQGPFVVTVDASAAVNDRFDEVPLVGESLPTVVLEPVTIELISAAEFERAREGYDKLEFARATFLWAGLGCIALGLAVSTRRRYVAAKFLLAVGAIALVAAAVVTLTPRDALARALPGATEGPFAALVEDAVGEQAAAGLVDTLVWAGVGALAASGVLWWVGSRLRPKR